MTNRDAIKNFSEENFVNWLASFNLIEDSPWLQWFDKTYCKRCQRISGRIEGGHYDHLFAPCEFGVNECPFGVADLEDKELIKLWLDAEI